MYIGVLPACMSVYHVCLVHMGQKWASDPLKQELQIVVSCHVSARNCIRVPLDDQPLLLMAGSSLQPLKPPLGPHQFSAKV